MLRRRLVLSGLVFAGALVTTQVGEITRTLRQEIAVEPGRSVTVENLAGAMRIRPGSTARLVAVATVHGESDALVDSVRFAPGRDAKGNPRLRVDYPVDRHADYRYPGEGGGASWFGFGGGNTRVEYGGERVTVSGSGGVLLYADLEIEVPSSSPSVTFRNQVGKIVAEDLNGTFRFDSASGGITLTRVKGTLTADTGSGDVEASDIEGTLACDTGSGDVNVTRFQGEKLSGDVGSGSINAREVRARIFQGDTGSGDIRIRQADLEVFEADTGSGGVTLECQGSRLSEVRVDTGSGDVSLRLHPDASFEVRSDQGSGDIRMGFRDAEPILKRREVIGYRRGESRIHISVSTGSGDLEIEPAS